MNTIETPITKEKATMHATSSYSHLRVLRAGEAFFAQEAENVAGRLYVGVFASALSSHALLKCELCRRCYRRSNAPTV